MPQSATVTFNDSVFQVAGDLSFKNVMLLNQACMRHFEQCPELIFDFSHVTSSDSSGLALVIEWIKFAEKANKKIRFKNLSNSLMSIATASGLDKLIRPLAC